MTKVCILISVLFVTSVVAEDLYVRPSSGEYGSENGSNWDNAFDGWSDISWGGAAGQVGPGDTLYVAAGSYTGCTIGDSGSSGSPLVIQAAQDTHTGVATLGGLNFLENDYVTITGQFGSSTNFAINGGTGQNCSYCKLLYFTSSGTPDFYLEYGSYWEIGYFNVAVDANAGLDAAFSMEANVDINAYDVNLIHNGRLLIPSLVNDGTGMDGFQINTGTTFSNVVLQSFAAAQAGSNHQDVIQCYGDKYLKIINCEFIDGGDSQIDFSDNSGSMHHLIVRNSIFRRTINNTGTVGLRIYTTGDTPGYSEIYIENNTFVDHARTSGSYGGAIRIHDNNTGSETASNCFLRNNIFYNCGDGWDALQIENITDNWDFSYNVINAGSQGNTGTGSWTQDAGAQSGAPSFVSYTAYNAANDYHLAVGDTAARGNGVDLSAYFTTDKDGVTRSAWDIGAFEYTDGEGPAWPTVPDNPPNRLWIGVQ